MLGVWGWSWGCSSAGAPAGARPSQVVRPGIEVLLSDSAHLVRNRRIGLVTNQSGVDAAGVSDVVRLRAAGVRLVALFSPEHGFRGAADPGAAIASSVDSATGLPIYSLYGRTTAPTAEMLSGIDVMLVDLQDVGARYYTWLFTTIEVMKAAGRHGVAVIVLDRPNPIGGRCRGTCSQPGFVTTVGQLAIPMRHGMTLGELARLARSDLGLEASLARRAGRRMASTDAARRGPGLPFIPPSPNLRTLESLYPLPRDVPLRGHATCRWAAGRTRRSSRSALRGSIRPPCSRGCERRDSPAWSSRASPFTPRSRATGNTPTPWSAASGSR